MFSITAMSMYMLIVMILNFYGKRTGKRQNFFMTTSTFVISTAFTINIFNSIGWNWQAVVGIVLSSLVGILLFIGLLSSHKTRTDALLKAEEDISKSHDLIEVVVTFGLFALYFYSGLYTPALKFLGCAL